MSTVQDAPAIAPITASEAADPESFLFDAEAFHRMIEADVFADDDRVELWDGRITIKMAKKIAHSYTSARMTYTLIRVVPPGWCVWPENLITIGQKRVPLPDFTLLRGTLENYAARVPTGNDVGLVVELSDSSLRYDTTTKLAGYAEAGIANYWVVNLVKNVIQTFAEPVPTERRYAQEAVYTIGQNVPLRLDRVVVAEIPAVDLLPVQA